MVTSLFSWVHPHVEVWHEGVTGIGSYATDLIKKGEIVIIQGGRIIPSALLDSPEYEPYAYHCFQIEEDFYICPIECEREMADGVFNVNHSCNPTCGFKGQVSMVAMRDIKAGEQITFDYAMSDVGSKEQGWIDMACLCGESNCRKTITGNDWKLEELQNKYGGYFSRYVQDLIKKGREMTYT